MGVEISDATACIVVTQSCCLQHGNLENEPFSEIVAALPSELDGLYTFGKHPRKAHFPVVVNGSSSNHQITVPDRHVIPREFLANHSPDPTRHISEDALRPLIGWLVARYQREAFPDQFQSRLHNIRKKLRKEVAKLDDVSDILIDLKPFDELPQGSNYEVFLIFVMPDSTYADETARIRCEKAVQEIRRLLTSCAGIDLVDDVLRSDAAVTVQDLRTHRRWGDFDYVSHED